MKRLMLLSVMFISVALRADDAPADAAINQSSSQDVISVSVSNVHHINLDNTDIDSSGNWLNKRIWYEHAQAVFDEILVLVSSANDLRIQFANEENAIVQKILLFYENVGLKQGELMSKIQEMISSLDVKQKLVGDLSPEERTLQTSLKDTLPMIDQIEKDIKAIGEADDKIGKTIVQATKTIDECREFETKAWDLFKTIAKELDDKKARNFYYQMNNYKQNIEQKNKYLTDTLLPYLHNVLVAKIEKNITTITSSIDQLKTKGLDLEKIMKKNQEDDVAEIQKREKQAAEIAIKKAVEEEQEKAKAEAEKAAEKAAKDLESAQKNSFSNVIHGYYQATIGKVVNFVYGGYVFVSELSGIKLMRTSISSYNFPVAQYAYKTALAIRAYMHDLVDHLMSYFGSSKPKKNVEDKTVKAEAGIAPTAVLAPVSGVTQTPPALVSTAAQSSDVQAVSGVQASVVSSAPVATEQTTSALVASTDQQVVVQSLQQSNLDGEQKTMSLYHVCTMILNFIGTIFMSLYNCFVQFFKLLLSFSIYLAS